MMEKKIVILGAGLCGMTAAIKLIEQGYDVTVLEQRDRVGGQAMSITHKGAIFDLGPHAWHTLSKDLMMFYLNICKGENVFELSKNAGIFFNNNYYNYPLKTSNLIRTLPIQTAFKCFLKYLIRPKKLVISAEDSFLSMYGEGIYSLFFKKYTERVWGIHPSQISSKFFYKRIANLNLFKLMLRTFGLDWFEKKPTNEDDPAYSYQIKGFYPEKGSGFFAEKIAQKITESGGSILLDSDVIGISHDNNRIISVSYIKKKTVEHIDCGYCISSIPITSLVQNLNPRIEKLLNESKTLIYRAIIIVCLIVNREHVSDFQVIYFYNNIFTRIGIMNHYSISTSPAGKTAITVELTCFEGDEIWNSSAENLKDVVVDELSVHGLFKKDEVKDYTIMREKYGYPVLKVGDPERLDRIFKGLDSFRNLSVVGRQGKFDYIQMADAVRQGFESVEQVNKYYL